MERSNRIEILLVDDKIKHHFYITDSITKVFPEARVIHAYSMHEALQKITERQRSIHKLIDALRIKIVGKPKREQEAIRVKIEEYKKQVYEPFDAIISDLNMESKKAGLSLLEEIKRMEIKTPFCLVSAAYDLKAFEKDAYDAGADEVHLKLKFMNPKGTEEILMRMFAKKQQ